MEKLRFKDFLIDYLEFNNITNKDFANRIGVTPKHLIDILSGNKNISAQTINNISIVTNIPVDYIYKIETNYKLEIEIEKFLKKSKLTETEYLNKFNYKYLIKENFLSFLDTSDKLEIIKDILKFLRVSSPKLVDSIDKTAYFKSKNDKHELLLLWLEKCYRETLNQTVGKYKKENISVLVNYIKSSAQNGIFNEKDLIAKFNENGIFLVIIDDIPGSKIRGAFKVHRTVPAIYLTHKHKRIADIYFALLHELAHCKSDFNKAKATSLISFDEPSDELELKRNMEAYNWMVEDKYYQSTCIKPDYNINDEKQFPKNFVLYRLASDKYISYNNKYYQKYNKFIQ